MSNTKKTRRPRSAQHAGRDRDARRPHRDGAAANSLARRLDSLDEKIWLAARTTDDPHLTVRAARDFADAAFFGLVLAAGSGHHRLNCAVATPSGAVTAPEELPMSVMASIGAVALPENRADNELCELMALAHAGGSPATIVLRTCDLETPTFESADGLTIRGWRIADRRCEPLDAAGIFAVCCCSDPVGGQPLPIHPGTRYEDACPLIGLPGPGRDDLFGDT